MTGRLSFESYCHLHQITPGDEPIAFAAYLHELSGGTWDGENRRVDVEPDDDDDEP